MIVSFPGSKQASLAEVGGKGYGLIQLVEAGFRVPPGVVLTTGFFTPWVEEIQASQAWAAFAEAPSGRWGVLCEELKSFCIDLALTSNQRQAIAGLHRKLESHGRDALFAVRSSSPEEDLAAASFAGGYATRLGVRPAGLEDAIRHCFASCLDERVFVYKREQGFDVLNPRIAVVVQRQIDSAVAGVGFSLNPLTNDYDEAVIDANWGLGESVVDGLASPDHVVMDKVGRRVVDKKLGAKRLSVWLDPNGGTVEREAHRSTEFTLNEVQLDELVEVLCRIEAFYKKPMDVEWAFAGGQLHVLQARPITAFVPLPPEMITAPGERRLLYIDIGLADGLTINAPISPMGIDSMQKVVDDVCTCFLGPMSIGLPFEQKLFFLSGGRMYENLSNILWLVGPERLAKLCSITNVLLAETLSGIDARRYRSPRRPPWAGWKMLGLLPRVVWAYRGLFTHTLLAFFSPRRAHQKHEREVEAFEREMQKEIDGGLPLNDFLQSRKLLDWMNRMPSLLAALYAGFIALSVVGRVVGKRSPEVQDLGRKLKQGFAGNVVTEMGIALYHLSKKLDPSDFEDLHGLSRRIKDRALPPDFLGAWDGFMTKHGCRGPMEMDVASPRYADDPYLVLRQMSFLNTGGEGVDPGAAQHRLLGERGQAYAELMRRLGWFRRTLLRRVYLLIDLFGATRDTPKYHLVLLNYATRKRLLIEGQRLVAAGRLDATADVFDLTFSDLESAEQDSVLDLRALREERSRFLKALKAHVKTFPSVIDSRGRILRPPPREDAPGELSGLPVSPGVVTGPVKVLHGPHEKTVSPGDVLVAYTTDPGWTPLFVNAAAVVIEIGGVLQHGAVIAREYGKPCVAGIDGLMTKLQDGQRVEVDGTTGVIRLLDES